MHFISVYHTHARLHTLLLFEEVLGSLAVVSKQREEVPGHVKLELRRPTLVEMIIEDHLTEKRG